MQKIYAFVFNIIYKEIIKIDERIRTDIVFLCGLFLISIYFFWPRSIDKIPGNIMLVGSIVISVMIVFSINKSMKMIRWNNNIYYPFTLFGLGILLIGMLHSVGDGYVLYALDLSILFPALYFVWNNRGDHDTLYKLLSFGVLIEGIISYLYCFYLASKGALAIEDGRVAGYKWNVNYLAMLGVVILLCSLYLLLIMSHNKACIIAASLGVGIGIAYAIISVSRTAMLTELVCITVFMVFLVKMVRAGSMNLRCAIPILVLALIIAGIAVFAGMQLNDIHYRAVHAAETSETPPPEATTEDVTEPQALPAEETDEVNAISERINSSGDADSYSSGRVVIWKIYLSHSTMLGRPFKELEPDLAYAAETRAHNNIVEYFYRCGFLVGGIYVIFFFAAMFTGIKMFFSKTYYQPMDAFLVMVIGAYSIYAMLEISTLPFMRIIPYLFFMTIAPIFRKE